MRYKKRYILAYMDASLHGYGDHKTIIKKIRSAYAERFGREELDHARISFVYSKSRYGKGKCEDGKKGDEGEDRQMQSITTGIEERLEYDATKNARNLSNGRMMLTQIIIRCRLEHYAHVMHILYTLGIRTVKTSGTLKALRKSDARQYKARIIRVKE
ncbi:MAG: hypothetical protein ACK4FV_00290 [Candidatus Nitrosocaldus sp.]